MTEVVITELLLENLLRDGVKAIVAGGVNLWAFAREVLSGGLILAIL